MTQPTPQSNDREHVQQRAIDQLVERYHFGIEKYGTAVQLSNGRKMAMDAREEIQDLLIYMTGVEMIHDEVVKIVRHLITLHQLNDQATDVCGVCMSTTPCHTRVDLEKILDLLGENHH